MIRKIELKEIVKSSRMGVLVIKEISKKKAQELIVKNHYSKKWNHSFGIYNYGIFKQGKESENNCLGVASYGYMKVSKAKIFKHPNPNAWLIELNRMWISDELGKNAESILIFKYFGKHLTIFCENKRTGEIVHQQNLTNTTCRSRYIRDNVAFLLGDFRTFKVKTHRYIYPLCPKFEFTSRKEQKYPPYEKGEIKFDWKRDKEVIKERLTKFIKEL